MLEVCNVKKSFGEKVVLDDVNFKLNGGEIACLLGKNGVGKTTLIKTIIGVLKKDDGKISIDGVELLDDEIKYKMSFGYVPDDFEGFSYLTASEYFNFIINVYKLSKDEYKQRLNYLINLFDIEQYLNIKIETYSKGTKQKVMIIGAILHNPKVIILDEPFNGLDIETVDKTKRLFKEYSEKGNLIVFSTHIVEVVKSMSNRVIILNRGKIILDYNENDIRQNYDNLEEIFLNVTKS